MILYLLSSLIALIWGINAIINKILFDHGIETIVCFVISSIFYFATSLLIILFDKKSHPRHFIRIDRKCWILLTLYSTLSIVAYFTYLYAIKHTSDINTIIAITCISPIITLLISKVFMKSHTNWKQMLGICLSIIGVLLVVLYS